MSETTDHLETFLRDHHTLIEATLRLVRRHLEHGEWEPSQRLVEPLAPRLQAELSELEELMERHGVSARKTDELLTWLAEKFGRLKLNDRLVSRSALSEVTELEALAMTSRAREMFWRGLPPHLTGPGEAAASLGAAAREDAIACERVHRDALVRALPPEAEVG